jgi:hypothetical protein
VNEKQWDEWVLSRREWLGDLGLVATWEWDVLEHEWCRIEGIA